MDSAVRSCPATGRCVRLLSMTTISTSSKHDPLLGTYDAGSRVQRLASSNSAVSSAPRNSGVILSGSGCPDSLILCTTSSRRAGSSSHTRTLILPLSTNTQASLQILHRPQRTQLSSLGDEQSYERLPIQDPD